MGMADVCRVCLSGQRRLFAISNTVFQVIWEKLTNAKFNTNNGKPKPLLACYICCAQLRKSHQLMKKALDAEELLTDIINNKHSEQSQKLILSIASQTNDFDYKYAISEVYHLDCNQLNRSTVEEIKKENEQGNEEVNEEDHLDCNQFNRSTVEEIKKENEQGNEEVNEEDHLDCNQLNRSTDEEIKKENEQGNEEVNEEESNININEEREDCSDVSPEESLDIADVESGTPSDDNTLLKDLSEREVRIILERIDMGASVSKRQLNEAPLNSKIIKLIETTKDREPLANAVLQSLPNNSCKATDVSLAKNLSANNVENFKRKQIIKSTVTSYQVKKTSPKEYIPPTRKIQAKNAIVENNKTLTFQVCHSNPGNGMLKQCLPKSGDAVAPSTPLDRSDEGNKTSICNKKGSENVFRCHICEYKGVTRNILNRHIRKHTGEKPFTCDLCDYRCSRKCHLTEHIKYKHTKERKISCHLCEYKCVTKSDLNKHFRVHTGDKPYICNLCDYRCSHRSSLREHIKNRHKKKAAYKKISCHLCQYKCVTNKELNKHLDKHSGDKPYFCDWCDYRSSHESSLRDHIKIQHTKVKLKKVKNYACHMCEYKGLKKYHLNIHLRKHTGEKPYMCDLCDYRCSQKGSLVVHIMYKHTNEKKFSCHICQYKFVTKKDLIEHIRKHTGDKPYNCEICDFKCSIQSNLKKHLLSKHAKNIMR